MYFCLLFFYVLLGLWLIEEDRELEEGKEE
jgi:hypothetical protein